MAKRNRETLKNYFREGRRPSEQDFEDLIDSTLNTLDDGFSGSPHIGIGLSPLSEQGTIISTYRNAGDAKPVWEIAVDKNNGDLQIKKREEEVSIRVLTLKYHPEKKGGTQEIVFDSQIVSPGRKGSYKTGMVEANGKWHDILGSEEFLQEGCWAFEIVAGCGERNKGRYALLVATVMHCYGNKPKIKKVRSHFGFFGNKICVRWVKIENKFTCRLQLKTFFKYDEGTMIKYQITNLWDNPTMEG